MSLYHSGVGSPFGMESTGTRVGRAFKKMGQICPTAIAAYGKCLVAHADSVEKNVCAKEFEALKSCFRKARITKK